jgi:arylsulfatase A-like enzyme
VLTNRYVLLLGPVIGLISGCAGVETVEQPLIDSRHRPIVLTERRAIGLPSSMPGNRFVRGWSFHEESGSLRIRPAGAQPTLEIVRLTDRERSLVVQMAEDAVDNRGFVHVTSQDLEIGRFEFAKRVEIPLPTTLGHGRFPITFEFSDPAELVRVSVSAAAHRGLVEFEGADALQSGWSAVDIPRWIATDTRLIGQMVLPPDVSASQQFSIVVDSQNGRQPTVFTIDSSTPRHNEGAVPIDLRIESTGPVRIRLLARGRGPAGRWRDLKLISHRRVDDESPAPAPTPPKLVVVYVFDALRADYVDHLGAAFGASPCIDRLASEGVTFTHHFSVAPNTGPATVSLFTGRGFMTSRGLSESGPETLAEIFDRAGYTTASISSNPHLSPSYGLVRGFEHVEFLPLEQDHRLRGEVKVNDSAARIHAAALRWLDGRTGDEPLFLYLHTLHPHNPYTPPEPYPSRFVSAKAARMDGRTRTMVSIRDLDREVTLEDQEWVRQRYTANLAYNDAELCKLVSELERRYPGQMMITVTSDHGEELFDHDGVLHGYTLYDEMLRVPLMVWWPESVEPKVIAEPTDTLDLHATLRHLVAGPLARRDEDGRSLWKTMTKGSRSRPEPHLHFATAPGLRWAAMARSERWKLILVPRPRLDWGMGRGRGRSHEAEYLFHLETDPEEMHNLAGRTSVEADWLWSRLHAWRATWRSRQPADAESDQVDEGTRRQLEALGYIE